MSQRSPGVLRIIGGYWRSRQLRFDPGCMIRPTPDRVRQTVFDWLAPLIEGAHCLDLYAGSGALGFEALSRGAASVTFIERDARQVAMLRQAALQLQAGDLAHIIHGHALACLRQGGPWRVVFVDPPYNEETPETALQELTPLLTPVNRVYVEWPCAREPALPAGYEWVRQKRAGRVSYGLVTCTQRKDKQQGSPP